MKKAKDYYKYEVVNEWCVPEYFETLYEARMFARDVVGVENAIIYRLDETNGFRIRELKVI